MHFIICNQLVKLHDCKFYIETHDGVLFFIEFECYSNEHCNFHGSCNIENQECACDTKWKDSQDCSGNY